MSKAKPKPTWGEAILFALGEFFIYTLAAITVFALHPLYDLLNNSAKLITKHK